MERYRSWRENNNQQRRQVAVTDFCRNTPDTYNSTMARKTRPNALEGKIDKLTTTVTAGFDLMAKGFSAAADDISDLKHEMMDIRAAMVTKVDYHDLRQELRNVRTDLKELRENVENVSGFRKEIRLRCMRSDSSKS